MYSTQSKEATRRLKALPAGTWRSGRSSPSRHTRPCRLLKGGSETSSPPGGVPIQNQNIQAKNMGTATVFQMITHDSKVPSTNIQVKYYNHMVL